MPYSDVEYVKNATKDVLANIYVEKGVGNIIVYTTSKFEGVRILIKTNPGHCFDKTVDISPENTAKYQFNYTGRIPGFKHFRQERKTSSRIQHKKIAGERNAGTGQSCVENR